ncbi:MAG TPA: hypothetical protein VJ866_10380 [Pyrinomonadaceae bacterium]|nr:hypothetical protein [Pyrinomonadaceae bacterium]
MGAPQLKLVTNDNRDDSPHVVYVKEEPGLGSEWRKFKYLVVFILFAVAGGPIISAIVLAGIAGDNKLLAVMKPYLYPDPPVLSKNVGREMVALKDINIRETPGKESSANRIGRCGQGTEFQVLETNAPENWYRVKVTKKVTLNKHQPCPDEGWVFTENLKFIK